MKAKIYLLVFAGIVAISLAVFSILTVDPAKETWSSVALGMVVGFLIVRGPKLYNAIRGKKQVG
ncbi:hypothetical protein FFF34_015730 [Inquilinus sp. KBS0705]|nr:hypothetical protein FFF34_015730 [Inquilinus sp. KBS0705]